MISSFITNPIVISVILLCTLCLCRVNVLLALIISSVVGGLAGNIELNRVMDIFIHGMGANSETALSYILLGAFAASMTHTGLAPLLSLKISNVIKSKKYMLIFILTGIAILSQNLIPVHIAFIPILVPPLLVIMNELKIDRRAVACGLAFGLKAPYIAIPAGFGLIFQGLIAENMMQNGIDVIKSDVWKYNSILGFGMFVGFLIAIFISYRKQKGIVIKYDFLIGALIMGAYSILSLILVYGFDKPIYPFMNNMTWYKAIGELILFIAMIFIFYLIHVGLIKLKYKCKIFIIDNDVEIKNLPEEETSKEDN